MGLALKDCGKQFPAPFSIRSKHSIVVSCHALIILPAMHLQQCFLMRKQLIPAKFIVNKSNAIN